MKKLTVILFVLLAGCTYAPHYTVDSYNTYAPSTTTVRTTTNEWAKDLAAIEKEFKQSLNSQSKPKIKKTTKYIYGRKK